MRQYLDIVEKVITCGKKKENRTGIVSRFIPGMMFRHDMTEGFPLLTSKRVFWHSVFAELLGFIRGYDNAADFRRLGTHIWDANANKNADWVNNPNRRGEDDLGRIYGVQWRRFEYYRSVLWGLDVIKERVDQLRVVIDKVKNNPLNRFIMVSAWHPGELDQMALPPCHFAFQLIPDPCCHLLHLMWYQRSCDVGLGLPYDIASYGALLFLICSVTGYMPGVLTGFLGDVHIYENHEDALREQLTRDLKPLPRLLIRDGRRYEDLVLNGAFSHPVEYLESLEVRDFVVDGYDPHPAIRLEMAV